MGVSDAGGCADQPAETEGEAGGEQAEDELADPGEQGAAAGEQGYGSADDEQSERGTADCGCDGCCAGGEEVGQQRDDRPQGEQHEGSTAGGVGRSSEGGGIEA